MAEEKLQPAQKHLFLVNNLDLVALHLRGRTQSQDDKSARTKAVC